MMMASNLSLRFIIFFRILTCSTRQAHSTAAGRTLPVVVAARPTPCAKGHQDPGQGRTGTHQVASHGAADATIHHLDDLLLTVLQDDGVVHTDFAELVLDNRELHAMMFLQDVIQQRCLPSSEKPRQHLQVWTPCELWNAREGTKMKQNITRTFVSIISYD